MKQLIKLLPLTMMLFLVCCNTDDPEPIEKEFFVKCFLNGEDLENCCDDCGGGPWGWAQKKPIFSQYYADDGQLEISVGNNCELNNGFLIASDTLFSYEKEEIIPASYYYDNSLTRDCQKFKLLESPSNFMQLTEILDERVTGIFEVSYTNECGDTVRLTQGSFRVATR